MISNSRAVAGPAKAVQSNRDRRTCWCLAVSLVVMGACSKTTAPTAATTTTSTTSSLITPATTVLIIGQSQLYSYSTATSTDGVSAWTSSNSGILTIDNTGLATGISNGLATITGSLTDGTTSTLAVQVVPNYQGSWAGTSSVLECTDLMGFTSAGYCAQIRSSVQQWTLTLLQSALQLSGTMTKSEGANVLSGNVTGIVGGSGDIITMVGSLGGFASGANLVITPISWDSFSVNNTMTGNWAGNVTSPQITGLATVQWSLSGTAQVPASVSRAAPTTSAHEGNRRLRDSR
jgi:hypothetical protein